MVQLDNVLVNKKWRNSAIDYQACNTFHPIQSDHRPCATKTSISLRKNKTSITKNIHYDWLEVFTDDKVRNRYTIEVKNRFQELQELVDNETLLRKNEIVVLSKECSS